MKVFIISILLLFSVGAQTFEMKSVNTKSNIDILIIDNKTVKVFSIKLSLAKNEGINILHRTFKYMDKEYVVNIFANQKYISKKVIKGDDSNCQLNMLHEKLLDIKSEISFSISLGYVADGFLNPLDVEEGIETIDFKKRVKYRCNGH